MVSSLVQAKWFILGCIIATPPADIALVLVGSSLSPMPMLKVPEITVTCSIAGCECAGILKSAGSLMRKVKGTASFSGPSMTAICAPGGNAGTSVHLRSECVTNACPSAAYVGGIRKTQSPPKRAAVIATGLIVTVYRVFMIPSHEPAEDQRPEGVKSCFAPRETRNQKERDTKTQGYILFRLWTHRPCHGRTSPESSPDPSRPKTAARCARS